MYNQDDILITLAYLLGERSVNATTSAPRADFIQETLREAYGAYPWRFATATATLAISNGVATLPTNFDISHPVHITWFNGDTETSFDQIDGADKKDVIDGDSAAWIDAVGDGDRFTVNTKDTVPTQAVVRYQKKAPVLSDSVYTPYPNKTTLALGARRYVKLGQNPDADISQDQAIFEKRLNADIASHQVPSPRKRRRTAQGQTGTATGDF